MSELHRQTPGPQTRDTTTQPDGHAEARPAGVPDHAHEGTDIRIRPLAYMVVGFLVFAVLTHIGLWILLDALKSEQGGAEVRKTELENVSRDMVGPKLQGEPSLHENTPSEDMDSRRRYNEYLLQSVGPVEDPNLARIPIDRAMDLALKQQIFKTGGATRPAGQPGNGGGGGTQDTPERPTDQPPAAGGAGAAGQGGRRNERETEGGS